MNYPAAASECQSPSPRNVMRFFLDHWTTGRSDDIVCLPSSEGLHRPTFDGTTRPRCRAVAARQAHNLEVVGSNPASAILKKPSELLRGLFCLRERMLLRKSDVRCLALQRSHGCAIDGPVASPAAARAG